jgi:hypothetical protein
MAVSVSGTNLFETGVNTRQLSIGTGTLSSVLNLAWNGGFSELSAGSSFRQLLGFDTSKALIKGASARLTRR